MDAAQGDEPSVPRIAKGVLLTGILALAGIVAPRPCPASPIKTTTAAQRKLGPPTPAVLAPGSFWDQYYAKALKEHSTKVKGLDSLTVLKPDKNGYMPSSSMLDYLHWRRSLDVAGFDKYHPVLGPWLERDEQVRSVVKKPPIIKGPTTNPKPRTTKPPSVQPGGVNPPPVPEPGSALVAVVLAGAGLWARRWRAIRARR
jgi:hypothetical protein